MFLPTTIQYLMNRMFHCISGQLVTPDLAHAFNIQASVHYSFVADLLLPIGGLVFPSYLNLDKICKNEMTRPVFFRVNCTQLQEDNSRAVFHKCADHSVQSAGLVVEISVSSSLSSGGLKNNVL